MFNFDGIISVEFGVCRDSEAEDTHVLAPINNAVREALKGVLESTRQAFGHVEDQEQWAEYEPSQKYGVTERLRLPLNAELCEGPRTLYEAQNIEMDATALNNPTAIEFYFAVFLDNTNRKLVGVRRATQFKGVVGARGRLMSMLNETLRIVEDTIFKLDTDFDYLVSENHVYILRPSGFEYTADIDEHILAHAVANTRELGATVACINFDQLAVFVRTHKRAARLVASLRTRADLAVTSLVRLREMCASTGVEFAEANGKLGPVQGQELAFLMLLDRRRYSLSLIDGLDERYEAANRRGVNAAGP